MIERPGKIVCVGLNYRDHAEEAGLSIPDEPLLFAKWPSCVIGPDEPIVLPDGVHHVDYEGELGVVIGRQARAVPVVEALDVIAGYVAANDISARDAQKKDGQWTRAKSYDTFCPVGPRVIAAAEVGDSSRLAIQTRLNGDVVQSSTTANLIFSIPELISYISRCVTLLPGDLVLTGTPGGVGMYASPPRWLAVGDVLEVEIERVGTLRSPICATNGAPRFARDESGDA
jgi:2-keto-4-pentenoate hydratase/2-oxohepta-3-ene-1,7-dioic acid hydratase in catechol pathway